ncbi:MAG: IclR family transcriptional regulator [Syntrophorhabdaceae bacterium]|nr:IclR family transcriptional regulator [Syntrophorhabdaceae bacterium]
MSEYTGTVPAVDQASRILLYLAKHSSNRVNLTDICKSLGIHKSKGYSILNTLQRYGFVQKDPKGKTYSLGLGLLSLSRRVLDNLNYGEVVGPYLENLARGCRSTALFGLINNDNVYVVARKEWEENISVTIKLGYRFHLTHGAHGKAIVSYLPKEEVERILSQKRLFFYGDTSKFDRKRLEKDIIETRKAGYAFDMGELNPGINVIASPVFDSQDRLFGTIFIMGTFPENKIKEFGSLVGQSARDFSHLLGANVDKCFKP